MDSNDRERVQEAKEELRKMVCMIIQVCITIYIILYMENHVHSTLAINRHKKEN